MQRKIPYIVLGLFLLAGAALSRAQQAPTMPTDVCQAIEVYVAQINTAGSLTAKAERERLYASSLKDLNGVLKRYGKQDLSTKASEFADYTEQVTSCDPTNSTFGALVEKQLQSRAWLQNLCMPYTTAR